MTPDGWATARPKVPGTEKQRDALQVALGRLMLPECQRAVLAAIVRYANGAGYAWPSLTTIGRESGYSRAQVCGSAPSRSAAAEVVSERRLTRELTRTGRERRG